jgi:hypothetical protein
MIRFGTSNPVPVMQADMPAAAMLWSVEDGWSISILH